MAFLNLGSALLKISIIVAEELHFFWAGSLSPDTETFLDREIASVALS